MKRKDIQILSEAYNKILFESINTKKPDAPKSANKTDKNEFWRKKKKIAQGHMKRADATGNGGWKKMLQKRISKYESKVN